MKALKLRDFKKFTETIYGKIIRIKVAPFASDLSKVLVGSGLANCFYESPVSLYQRYGDQVDAGWCVLGQINAGTQHAVSMKMEANNPIEDAIEGLILKTNAIVQVSTSPAFPAVSFAPLAIYRTIAKPN